MSDTYENLKAQKEAILAKSPERRALKMLAEIRNAHFEFEGQGGEQMLGGEFWDEVDKLLSEVERANALNEIRKAVGGENSIAMISRPNQENE